MKIKSENLFILFLLLLTACNDTKKYQIKESYSKSIEKITLFSDISTSLISQSSNSLIWTTKHRIEDIDTFKLTDKNSKLFIDLQILLATAKIDSSLVVGAAYEDSTFTNVIVKNDAIGYIVDHGYNIDTITLTDSRYYELKRGYFKDIPINETEKRKYLSVINYNIGKNDICADDMILYQYCDGTPNDTICFGTTDTVRINSYIATVDSFLLETVRDSITSLLIYR